MTTPSAIINSQTNSQPSTEENIIEILLEPGVEGSISKNESNKDARPKNPRSQVYQYFEWKENQWKCSKCKRLFTCQRNGSTGNLVNHIKNSHAYLLKKENKEENPETDKNCFSLFKNSDTPNSEKEYKEKITKEGFRRKVINHIICSDQPFTLVEEMHFRDLIRYVSGNGNANRDTDLFCAKTAKTLIESFYEEEKGALKDKLSKNDGKISFIIDCWTSSNQIPFQGVVAKWISNDWQLQTSVIDLTPLKGSHTGANIAESFSGVLEEYDLWSKMLSVTTDNASNMDIMFAELEKLAPRHDCVFDSKNYRVRCFAHILNLACKDIVNSANPPTGEVQLDSDSENEGMETTQEIAVVAKLRKGVVAIRKSPQRREVFERHCNAAKLIPKNLLRDVSTRWNSTLIMLERAVEMKEPFELTLRTFSRLRKCILDDEEWKQVAELVKILGPFKEATVMLSNEHSPTISRTSAVYQLLFEHLEAYMKSTDTSSPSTSKRSKRENHSSWIIKAAERGWEKLKKYYPSSDGLVYIVGTVLDPRCKLQWYKATGWPKDWIDFSRKSVTDIYKAVYQPKQQVQEGVDKADKVEHFQDVFNRQMKNIQKGNTEDELKRYLTQSVVSAEMLLKDKTGIDGSLGWWKIHEKEFPNLSRMAKDFLAVSGTGVPVERLFSSGPDILTQRRQNMNAKSIKMCVCLKSWIINHHSMMAFNEDMKDALQYKLGVDFEETNYD